jgi:hypothetical protein
VSESSTSSEAAAVSNSAAAGRCEDTTCKVTDLTAVLANALARSRQQYSRVLCPLNHAVAGACLLSMISAAQRYAAREHDCYRTTNRPKPPNLDFLSHSRAQCPGPAGPASAALAAMFEADAVTALVAFMSDV